MAESGGNGPRGPLTRFLPHNLREPSPSIKAALLPSQPCVAPNFPATGCRLDSSVITTKADESATAEGPVISQDPLGTEPHSIKPLLPFSTAGCRAAGVGALQTAPAPCCRSRGPFRCWLFHFCNRQLVLNGLEMVQDPAQVVVALVCTDGAARCPTAMMGHHHPTKAGGSRAPHGTFLSSHNSQRTPDCWKPKPQAEQPQRNPATKTSQKLEPAEPPGSPTKAFFPVLFCFAFSLPGSLPGSLFLRTLPIFLPPISLPPTRQPVLVYVNKLWQQ